MVWQLEAGLAACALHCFLGASAFHTNGATAALQSDRNAEDDGPLIQKNAAAQTGEAPVIVSIGGSDSSDRGVHVWPSTSQDTVLWATNTTTTATTTLEPEKCIVSFSLAGLTLDDLNTNPTLKANLESTIQISVAAIAGVPIQDVDVVFVGASSFAAITHGKTKEGLPVTATITASGPQGGEEGISMESIETNLASEDVAGKITTDAKATSGLADVADMSSFGVGNLGIVVFTTTKTSTTKTSTTTSATHPDNSHDRTFTATKTSTTTSAMHPDDTHDQTDVSSYGDPHTKNIHGQRFDIRRPGNHSFLVLPRGADQGRANLYVEARVTRRGGLCTGKLFITGLKLAGRWVRALGGDVELYAATEVFNSPKVVGLKLGNSSNISLEDFVARIPKHNLEVYQSRPELPAKLNTHVNTLRLQFKVGPSTLKVGWAHEKLNDGFANWLWMSVSGLGTTDEVGGLLGSDDHSTVQTAPKDELAACQANPGPEEPSSAAGLVEKPSVFRSWAFAEA